MADPTPVPAAPAPAVSPTGAPTLAQGLVKFAVPFFSMVAVIAGLPEMGISLPYPWWPVVVNVAKVVLGLGVALGIASQGARKKEAADAGVDAAAQVNTKADALSAIKGGKP